MRRPYRRVEAAAGARRLHGRAETLSRLDGDLADDVRLVAAPPADEQRGGDGRRQRNDGADPQGVVQAVDVGLRRALAEGGAGGDECAQRRDADRDARLAEHVVDASGEAALLGRAPSSARPG